MKRKRVATVEKNTNGAITELVIAIPAARRWTQQAKVNSYIVPASCRVGLLLPGTGVVRLFVWSGPAIVPNSLVSWRASGRVPDGVQVGHKSKLKKGGGASAPPFYARKELCKMAVVPPIRRCDHCASRLWPMTALPNTFYCPVCGLAQVVKPLARPTWGGNAVVLKGGDDSGGKET